MKTREQIVNMALSNVIEHFEDIQMLEDLNLNDIINALEALKEN